MMSGRNRCDSRVHDADQAAARVMQMIEESAIITQSGKRIPVSIDTICVHGDTDGALQMVKKVRASLEQAGIAVKPYCQPE